MLTLAVLVLVAAVVGAVERTDALQHRLLLLLLLLYRLVGDDIVTLVHPANRNVHRLLVPHLAVDHGVERAIGLLVAGHGTLGLGSLPYILVRDHPGTFRRRQRDLVAVVLAFVQIVDGGKDHILFYLLVGLLLKNGLDLLLAVRRLSVRDLGDILLGVVAVQPIGDGLGLQSG